uniref:Biotin carboxyl carrier protein of acetyl-CoA carboxylase n=1 Tax=Gastroclonium compressum TaxID=1852973 RepID=A0A173G050_GASCM|nr:acetyl-CoA carboxylase biotin carboxyl carrier protein [Coeloseira compressa]ANH09647.1 acetyl-CoA carboxylase biotin carboxyl carrier protein [Coeloseira compressa]
MKFKIEELKAVLNCAKNNHINFIKIKSDNFELIASKKAKIDNHNKIISTINRTVKFKKNQKPIKGILNLNIATEMNDKDKKNMVNDESSAYSIIISPMVGTFYRSPAPNEPAFVNKYDLVKKKQTVCIIEAMKLMNEIEAEVDGEIVEVLVKDGEIVDCGQALIKVKTN